MNDDATFRLALLVGTAAMLPGVVYVRLRWPLPREKLDRRQEGLFLLLGIRGCALVMALATVAFLIEPTWLAWSALPLPTAARWAGLGCYVGGGLFGLWTLGHLGANKTDTVVTRREHSLIRSGPYRWVRHPFYIATAAVVAGLALLTANALVAGPGAVVVGLLALRTPIEEAKLLEHFGDDYRRYRDETGALFPRLFK